MLIVGLTGGLGSGKSEVASLFAKHHIPVIDADIIARDITAPGQPAYLDIIDHFEEKILLSDGSLDRAKLRKIILRHPEERLWLEGLLHPLILEEIKEKVARLDTTYCIVVIPLLFTREQFPYLDRILVVDSPEKEQIDRVMKRDQASREQVETMMGLQLGRQERLLLADDVILNDKGLADLKKEVDRLHEIYNL